MKYLIDTDWVIEYLKGRDETVGILRSLAQDGLAISLITFGEIYEGIYRGNDPDRHEQVFQDFLKGMELLPLDQEIMKLFARIRGQLRAEGQIIGDPDILIASTAIYHNLTLLSNNKRHFSRIRDLQIYNSK